MFDGLGNYLAFLFFMAFLAGCVFIAIMLWLIPWF